MKNKKTIIGALHFLPLIGYDGFTNYEDVLSKAIMDLETFESGGADAVIIENNYNLPHRIEENTEAIEMMLKLTKDLAKISDIPLGISVLWNDYESAFKIANESGAEFIRVPVFVDSVKTSYGEIIANPEKVLKVRKELVAENVKIYADVQVKHAEMVNERSIEKSSLEAIEKGADGIIITGKWTGDAPIMDELEKVRAVVNDFPIIIGSGADKDNIQELFKFADMAIVSTSLKEGVVFDGEVNLKPFNARISLEKVKEFVGKVKSD